MAKSETVTNRKFSAPRRISGKKATGKGVSTDPAPNREQIAQCAYDIWLKRGKPHGQDAEHWLQAEHELAAVKK